MNALLPKLNKRHDVLYSIHCEKNAFYFSELIKDNSKYSIKSHTNVPLLLDSNIWLQNFRASLHQFIRKKSLSHPFLITPPDHEVFISNVSVPPSDVDSVKQSIALALNQKFPHFLKTFFWKSIPCFPSPSNQNFLIFALKKTFAEDFMKVFQDYYFPIASVSPSLLFQAISLANLVPQELQPSLLIHIKQDMTNVAYVSDQKIFWMRNIFQKFPTNPKDILSFCQKIQENVFVAQLESQIELPPFSSLIIQSPQELAHVFKVAFEKTFLIPANHLCDLLPKHTCTYPFETIALENNLSSQNPIYVNFLPIDSAKRHRQIIAQNASFLTLSASVSLSLLFLILKHQHNLLKKVLVSSNQQLQLLERKLLSLAQNTQLSDTTLFKINLINALQKCQYQWVNIFNHIQENLRSTDIISINKLDTRYAIISPTVSATPPTLISLPQCSLDISGAIASDSPNGNGPSKITSKIAQFVDKLKHSKLITSMNITQTKHDQKNNATQFTCSMMLDPDSYL